MTEFRSGFPKPLSRETESIEPINDIQSVGADTSARGPRWAGIVVVLGLVVFGIYSASHMVAAGDTWVALACGRHFAEHGVDTVEPFSFNSHHAGPTEEDIQKWPSWARMLCKPFSLKTIQKWHPTGWINQNWLTHLIFYKLVNRSDSEGQYNYNMLVYWKFALFILTAFVVYAVGRTVGVSRPLALIAACFALVVGRSFFDIRPACWSNLLVPVFLLILALAVYKNIRYVWLLVPLVVFWANVHGGYIYAFIMLVPFLGLHLLAALPKKWTFALGLIGLWWMLYLISHQFLTSEYYRLACTAARQAYEAPALLAGGYAAFLLVLTAAGIGLLFVPERLKAAFFIFYGIVSLTLFFVFFMRMQTAVPYDRFTDYYKEIIQFFFRTSHLKFLLVFFLGILFTCLMTWKKERLVILEPKKILEVALAGAASFAAMILFNPFHLTNLTHTFEISVSEHAASWRQVNEWRPAFDWMDKTRTSANPVGEEEAFAVLCILAGAALLLWLGARLTVPLFSGKQTKSARRSTWALPDFWPRIDLPLLTLAAMTLYMGIQSRRFIAIAGPAACPFAALLIEQAGLMIAISREQRKSGNWKLPALPKQWIVSCWIGLAAALFICTLWWGWKYKTIYLDPWPNDSVHQSIFMRMTASNVKPFEVCEFINGNHLRGRMFNYWTEGGAVAFGQRPDPKTGQIPLQLFMDGRAQAAYNHDKYEYWQLIFSGGPETAKDKLAGKPVNYKKAGQWLSNELKKNQVWVVVMPNNQAGSVFMRALTQTDNWKTVYLDTTQQLLADTDTDEGRQLMEAVLTGKAFFPDELSRHLSTAMVIIELRSIQYASQLMEHAAKGFELKPCPSSFLVIQNATGWPPFLERGTQIIRNYLQQFQSDQASLRKQAGYIELLTVAAHAADYLAHKEPEQKNHYQQLRKGYKEEADTINNEAVW